MDEQIRRLQEFLDTSHFTVVITGAGISMAAGIKDMEHMNVFQVMQSSLELMVRARPEHSYKLLKKSFLKAMFINGPSITHRKLADLEKRSLVQGVITTNIDHLHTLAGSQNVAEIQGSYGINKCASCGQRYDDVQIWNQGKAPRCDECNGVILSFPVYSHVGVLEEDYQKAGRWMSQAELVLIAGSKGMYGGYFERINPRAKVVQINPKQTQFDKISKFNIRKEADQVFGLLN